MMKIKFMLLLFALHFSLTANAEKGDFPERFLGFGWIVGFGYDRAFFPSDRLNRVPTVEDFFKQKDKYGIRVNEEQNAYEALQQSTIAKIQRNGKTDTLYVTPILAYLTTYKRDTNMLRERLEMLQVYSHKGKVDSVFYRFDIDFDLQVSVIK